VTTGADVRFLGSILASNVRRLSHPFKLSFAVTYRCNMRCAMCNIWRKTPAGPELDAAQIDRFFRHASGAYWVGITGGEPFLREDLPEIVDSVCRHSRRLRSVHFATNGSLEERAVAAAERIRRHLPRLPVVFTVSVDGPPALHDTIRGREGAWERAAATFVRLKALPGVKAQVGFTLSHANVGRFEDAFEALRGAFPALRFDDVNVNVFQHSSFYYENLGVPRPDPAALRAQVARILALDDGEASIHNFLRRRYLRLHDHFERTHECPLECQALSSTCFVDPAGDLYPCAIYRRRLLNVTELDGPLERAWASEQARSIAADCSRGNCPGCWNPCDAFSAIGGSLARALIGRPRRGARP
jgi:MoaA/NifB/PqqE/SkfB family radical SAM enzyme